MPGPQGTRRLHKLRITRAVRRGELITTLDDVILATSELVTNAFLHAISDGPFVPDG